MKDPTLCFVKGNWAYFKTDSDMRPDNWNLVPYTWCDAPWGYIRLQFCVEMEQPSDPFPEDCCPWSVDAINSGEVPWLRLGNEVGIMGGCDLHEFIAMVYANDGAVAIPGMLRDGYFQSEEIRSIIVNYLYHRYGVLISGN